MLDKLDKIELKQFCKQEDVARGGSITIKKIHICMKSFSMPNLVNMSPASNANGFSFLFYLLGSLVLYIFMYDFSDISHICVQEQISLGLWFCLRYTDILIAIMLLWTSNTERIRLFERYRIEGNRIEQNRIEQKSKDHVCCWGCFGSGIILSLWHFTGKWKVHSFFLNWTLEVEDCARLEVGLNAKSYLVYAYICKYVSYRFIFIYFNVCVFVLRHCSTFHLCVCF